MTSRPIGRGGFAEGQIMDQKKQTRRAPVWPLAAVLIVLLSAAALFLFRFQALITSTGGGDTESYNIYAYHFAMVVDSSEDLFWTGVYESAAQAAQEAGACLELVGSGLSENYDEYQQMRMAIAQQVDGILVYPDGSERMTALIQEAVDRGIPVVTMMEDDLDSGRQAHVGGNSYDQGQEYGSLIGRLREEQGEEIQTVTVLMDNDRGSGQEILYSAILEACEGLNLSIQAVSVDNTNSFSAEEAIRDIIMDTERIPDVLVCLNYMDTISAYQAVVDYNRVGVVRIIGNYDSAYILSAIQKGIIHSTLTVDPELLGQQSIASLMEYLDSGRTSGYAAVDLIVITGDTVDAYLKEKEGEQ